MTYEYCRRGYHWKREQSIGYICRGGVGWNHAYYGIFGSESIPMGYACDNKIHFFSIYLDSLPGGS